jgi:hypothetical protein
MILKNIFAEKLEERLALFIQIKPKVRLHEK